VITPGLASLNTLRFMRRSRHAVALWSSSTPAPVVPVAAVPVVATASATPAASTCRGSSELLPRASAMDDTARAAPLTCTMRPRAGT
jgi:hypothetical protein